LAQDEPEVERTLTAALSSGRRELDSLASLVREAGFQAVVSKPMSLQPLLLSESGADDRVGDPSLAAVLASTMRGQVPQTAPVRFGRSLAVIEVLEVVRPVGPDELAAAALAAYRREVGERAFKAWLSELRVAAEIVVNPNLTDSDNPDLADLGNAVSVPTNGPGSADFEPSFLVGAETRETSPTSGADDLK
jgi:hypothetical protein